MTTQAALGPHRATYFGRSVELGDDGYFLAPEEWTQEMAPEIAAEEGIDELTDEHWRVIRFMRDAYERSGSGPSVRMLAKTSGVPIKDLYRLFPRGPAKVAARIAGIPKPRGCV